MSSVSNTTSPVKKTSIANHKRVFKLLERFDGQKPAIDVERALFFTQSMAENRGSALVLRWAKGSDVNVAKNITVMVQDDQLLLGRCGGHDGRYGILYPELDGDFLDIAVRDLPYPPAVSGFHQPRRRQIVVEQIIAFLEGPHLSRSSEQGSSAEVHKLTYDDPDGLIFASSSTKPLSRSSVGGCMTTKWC